MYPTSNLTFFLQSCSHPTLHDHASLDSDCFSRLRWVFNSTCPRIPLWIQPSRTSLRRVPHDPAHSHAPREPSDAKGEPDLPIGLHPAPIRPSRRLLISSSSLRTNDTYNHPFLSGGHATDSKPPSCLGAPVFPTSIANV
ncbi:hypothetical protein RhiXN_07871 [Rhizoctonia solani]|uniref:Uncharacterized protein n=1 Tax=Rhizoctonia solani TaxID=456999 RepID=A0A8H8P0H5_9AGAM|nr:uncharacterized protein RhiXN_07871 [Rhizoctonia solani]QRW22835.1 hypothetical protein RhiXN_07871 [Rhizoctonia solani]